MSRREVWEWIDRVAKRLDNDYVRKKFEEFWSEVFDNLLKEKGYK